MRASSSRAKGPIDPKMHVARRPRGRRQSFAVIGVTLVSALFVYAAAGGSGRAAAALGPRSSLSLPPALGAGPIATRPRVMAPITPAHSGTPVAWGPVTDHPLPGHQVLLRNSTGEVHDNIPQGDESNNWAGLTDDGTTFTSVSASWTVPTVERSSNLEESSTWVGVDGVNNSDLIQAGTEQDSGPNGGYFAWYEILPAPAQELGGVSPGDQISTEIEQVSPGTWYIDIRDVSNGGYATGDLPYDGPANSAEWIEEAPEDEQGNIATLADFGNVKFSNLGVSGDDIDAANLSQVTMVDNAGAVIAYPNNATASGFDVTYGAPGSSPPPTTTPSTTPTSSTGPTNISGGTCTSPSATESTSTTVTPGSAAITRLSGQTRIGTAIAVSNQSFPTGGAQAQAAVLASDADFPDALAGTPLAVAKDGPLLLTEPSGLDPAVASELTRVLPAAATVYLLGGTGALSDDVASAVTTLGFNVVRYGGATRFDTAVLIASDGLANPSTVLEATGLDFPDALAAGAAAAAIKGAVLLTNGTTQSVATTNYLAAFPSDTRYALGGPAAAADPTAKAIVGADRYATSTLVANTFFTCPSFVGIATGLDYPDALSGGAQVGRLNGPMVLTDPNALSTSTQSYLSGDEPGLTVAYIYGGPDAVSDTVQAEVAGALGVTGSSTTTTPSSTSSTTSTTTAAGPGLSAAAG